MTVSFPPHWQEMSNYELGGWLLGSFVALQAEMLGLSLDETSLEFQKDVVERVRTLEVQSAAVAGLEKAFHKAAQGDFETAGRFLREHMTNTTYAQKFIPIGMQKMRDAAKFAKGGQAYQKNQGEQNREVVLAAAREILKKRQREPGQNELAKLIEMKTGINYNTVRGHLRKLKKENLLG